MTSEPKSKESDQVRPSMNFVKNAVQNSVIRLPMLISRKITLWSLLISSLSKLRPASKSIIATHNLIRVKC